MKNKIFLSILGALVLLCCVALGVYYLYLRPLAMQNPSNSNAVINALSSQDYNSAITLALAGLKNPQDPFQKGQLTLLLAESLWARNQNDDRVQAIKYYKQVVNDYTIPPSIRASSLNDIAIVVLGNSLSFYRTNFPEAPYPSFISTSTTMSDSVKLMEVYANILKLSDDTYPTSFAEYALAGNYYTPSLYFKNNLSGTPEEMAKKMQVLIKEGDTRNDQSISAPLTVSLGYLYRALAINISGEVLGNYGLQEMEDAYKLVLTTESNFGRDDSAASSRARFYYAGLLLAPLPERKGDLVALLTPFSHIQPNDPAAAFFSGIKARPNTDPLKVVAVKLTTLSPDFKEFYEKL